MDTTLQIVITAVNSAAAGLSSVAESLSGLSTDAADAASAATESFAGTASSIDESMSSAAASADESMTGMATSAAASSEDIKSSISSIGGKLQALGIQGEILGATFLAPVVGAVEAAADKSSTLAQGLNQINNVIAGASGPTQENATQIASLQAKIDGYKASIASADAALTKWTGSTVAVAAAHEKANASIEAATANLTKYENELQPLLNQQNLVGASATDISNSFSDLATQNTNLGISFEDSYKALVQFFNQTKSTKDATAEYSAAVDLVASGKIPDMTTATQDVTQAFNGMGRSLQGIVPDMKQGVAGMDAVNQIAAALAGSPQIALQQFNTQIAAIGTKGQELAATLGTALLPALTVLAQKIGDIIDKLTAWFEKHQKIGEAILIFLGIVGGLLVILSPFLVMLGLLAIATEALNTVMIIFGGAATLSMGAVLAYSLIFLALIAAIALIIVYHKQIVQEITLAWDEIKFLYSAAVDWITKLVTGWGADIAKAWHAVWTEFETIVTDVWNMIKDIIGTAIDFIVGVIIIDLTALDPKWRQQWQAISDFFEKLWDDIKKFFAGLWNDIVGAVTTSVSSVSSAIKGPIEALSDWWHTIWQSFSDWFEKIWNGISSFVSGIINDIIGFFDRLGDSIGKVMSKVTAPLQAIGSFFGAVGSTIGGAINTIIGTGGQATNIAAFATGGIVNSPTLAMVGEAGPEAIIPLSAFAGGSGLSGFGGNSGGAGIVINISGNSFLDSGGATTIANAIARQIQMQLKLKNYF